MGLISRVSSRTYRSEILSPSLPKKIKYLPKTCQHNPLTTYQSNHLTNQVQLMKIRQSNQLTILIHSLLIRNFFKTVKPWLIFLDGKALVFGTVCSRSPTYRHKRFHIYDGATFLPSFYPDFKICWFNQLGFLELPVLDVKET